MEKEEREELVVMARIAKASGRLLAIDAAQRGSGKDFYLTTTINTSI